MNIIFDWGKVMAPSDIAVAHQILSVQYDYDEETFKKLLVDTENDFLSKASDDGYFDNIEAILKIPGNEIKGALNSSLPTQVFDLAKELATNGHNLYLLSDQPEFRAEFIKSNFDLSIFKGVYFSCDVGKSKYEHNLFPVFLQMSNLDPTTCLFIDDNSANIKDAEALGVTGVLFTGYDQLLEELSVKLV